MKRVVKRSWVGLGTLLGIIALLGGAVLVKVYLETRQLSALESREIVDGVYGVKDSYVNLFLFKTKDGYIAIDAGNNKKQVQQELTRMGIDPKKVSAVFLTHSDPDHIGGCSLFKNAVIYLSKAEEQMVNGQTHRFLFMRNKLGLSHELLENNQILTISGVRIKAILTPGHTPGSMSFLINDTYLFTGDSMGLKNGKVTGFNDIFNMDSQLQRRSITQLAELPGVKYVFTAHHGFVDSHETAFKNWTE